MMALYLSLAALIIACAAIMADTPEEAAFTPVIIGMAATIFVISGQMDTENGTPLHYVVLGFLFTTAITIMSCCLNAAINHQIRKRKLTRPK